MENMKKLLLDVDSIIEHHKEMFRLNGGNFNVFRVIGLESNEVRLHSAFLAELLNPKGTHGQGGLFLNLFANQLKIKPFDEKTTKVEVEKWVGEISEDRTKGGRIDIYVSDAKGNALTIENKIYASDQEQQLTRYCNHDSKNIFYLNLLGDCPTPNSIGELKKDEHFSVISYAEDILNWLINCRKEAATLPLIREGISHYINLVKYLTNQSTDTSMENEIIDLIEKTPNGIKTAFEIANSTGVLKRKFQASFFDKLAKALTQKGVFTDTKSTNLWIEIYKHNDTIIHWRVEIGANRFYTGFTLEKGGTGGISKLPENKKYRDIIEKCDRNYKHSQCWLGWKETNPKLDFISFNLELIELVSDEDSLRKFVESLAEEVKQHIDLVKQDLALME